MLNSERLAGTSPARSLVTLLVSVLVVVAFLFQPLRDVLEVNLHGLAPQSIVQVVGCHLLHWSFEHMFWDLGMFVLLGVICERWMPRAFYATVLGSALVIPIAVHITTPEITVYRGLSGIDTAIFSLLATSILARSLTERDSTQSLIFGGLSAMLWCKIGFEFYSGQVLFVQETNFAPLPLAHFTGALVGSSAAIWANHLAPRFARVPDRRWVTR